MVEAQEEQNLEGQEQSSMDAGVLMEEIIEILKVLNYEEQFLKNKGFKPLSRAQFVLPGSNPSE